MGVGMQVAVRERTVMGELDTPRAAPRAASLTRFHQRISAEALTAKSGVGASRLAPALAQSAVDLNPHQIEAAAFALSSMATGGCVLADEVGLGKTIEAGLVLAQLAAEGRGRILILVPASLRNQWRDELSSKFGLESTVVDGISARAAEKHGLKVNPFDTGGIVVASHAFAALRWDEVARVPWDLAVIDEAHRLRNAYRRDHKTGQALRKALRKCPKLLLTATPLQNDVMELLGLTAFIDDALLGTEEAFRLQFASGELTEDKAADLQERLGHVVIRTLRRQVKEYVKFTARRSLVEDFAPTPEEQELYDRVSEYLRREDAVAIPSRAARCSSSSIARSWPPRPSPSRTRSPSWPTRWRESSRARSAPRPPTPSSTSPASRRRRRSSTARAPAGERRGGRRRSTRSERGGWGGSIPPGRGPRPR